MNKNNKQILVSLIILILFLAGCSNLAKTNVDNLAMQEKCAKAAKDFFADYMNNQDDYTKEYLKNNFSFTNHYNTRLNKCLVIITDNEGDLGFHEVLYDAYENKEWGGIHTAGTTGGLCSIWIENKQQFCKNESEFNDLIKKYMEE